MNQYEYESGGTYWIALCVIRDKVTHFDSFGVEHITKKRRKNIYGIQAYNSIMYRYLCIGFIDFMLKIKSLLEYINLFFSNEYEKNKKIILKHFQ